MPQLIVRDLEEKVVRKLKQRAGELGVSVEEAHRRILRDALIQPRRDFKSFLLSIPQGNPGNLFARQKDYGRDIPM